jgi:mannose-6-phosphate isomerase-like protein (cupin superfamily)
MHPDEYQEMMDWEEEKTHWLLDKEEYNKDGFSQEEVEALTGIVEKPWGHYKVLHKGDGYTVKELTILPGKSLSDQRHFKRDEHWLVVKGTLNIDYQHPNMELEHDSLGVTETAYISKECWHRPHNNGTEVVKVIEVWLGDSNEDDIERR